MTKNKIILFLILFGFFLYFNALFNGFVWDDEIFILSNPLRQSIKNFYLFFLGTYSNIGGGITAPVYYRPIIDTYVAMIFTLFGQNTFFFHFFQIGIHILNSILIYLIFKKLFYKSSYLPIFLSFTFLVHPINVEAVVWISAIQELFFVTLGLIALLYSLSRDYKNKEIKRILIPVLIIFLSLLIKETGVLFYVIIFFYLLFFREKNFAFFHIFLSILSIFFYFLIRLLTNSLNPQQVIFSSIMHANLYERLITMPKVFLFYLTTFFYPKDLAISQHWVIKSINFYNVTFPLILIVCFFILCVIYILKTKNKLFLLFFIWLLIGLGIHSQIVPLSMTVAERWFYFPIIGMLGMIGIVIQKIKYKNIYILGGVGILIIIILSIRSFCRIQNWKTPLTLYQHDAKINKSSFDLENNLGVELARIGKLDEAGVHFKKSVKLDTYTYTNWTNLGGYYLLKKDYKKAEENYKKALKNANYYSAFENYASLLIFQKRYQDAKNLLIEGLKYYPDNSQLKLQYKTVIQNMNDIKK